jgi:hypothetical protein
MSRAKIRKYSAKPLSTLLMVVEIGGREMRKEEKVIFARDKPHGNLTLDCRRAGGKEPRGGKARNISQA